MCLRRVSAETRNKLFHLTKLQRVLDQFMRMDEDVVRVDLEQGEYRDLHSAQCSYHAAARRMRLPIKVRTLDGDLYLIKTVGKGVK